MAVIAGKVAPRFMGAYNSSTTYQFYDAVTYGNKLYFCKTSGTVGKTPSGATDNYWFLSLDGSFTDASELGGETAEQWQTKLDNIQTTSRATLSTAGWYRVAEYRGGSLSGALGASANTCDLSIKRNFGNTPEEYHLVRFKPMYKASNNYSTEFVSLGGTSATQAITKVRHVVDTNNNYISYLEIYYSVNVNNGTFFGVSQAEDMNRAWKAITPTLTSETVDGVTVTTTYDIPANASPVTDLDLFSNAETYRGLDFNTATETKIYSSMGNPSGDGAKNYPIDYTGMLIVFGGSVVSQKYVSFNGFVYERSKLDHADYAWSEWKQTATTADLANYLPLDGSKAMQRLFTIGSTDLAKYVAVLIKNNKRSLELGITEAGAIQFYDATNKKNVFTSALDGTNTFNGTATGNLPLNGGGTVSKSGRVVITANNTVESSGGSTIGFQLAGTHLGELGVDSSSLGAFYRTADGYNKSLLHTGNSAKVAIQSTAPTDTTALWVDTANKKTKAYIDGAWTALV